MVQGFMDAMLPRDRRAAVRTLSTLFAVAGVSSLVLTPFQPAEHTAGGIALVVAYAWIVVGVVLAVAVRHFRDGQRLAWVLTPLLGIVLIAVVDLLTSDSSVSAQIFFAFPVLYGASQLRLPGSVIVTTASVIGEVVVVAAQLPMRQVFLDAGFVAISLVTISVVLTLSSERQARLMTQLAEMAAADPLTGLVTRRVLDQAADSALSGAHSDEGTCLVLIDVDDFKSVNDKYGHPAGDEILVQVASAILCRTRREDVVCRLGGDEVAILLPGCSREVGRRRAEDLLTALRAHRYVIDSSGTKLSVTVSMGLAHAPSDARDLRSLYAAADAALYQAKRSGRARLIVAADVWRGAARAGR